MGYVGESILGYRLMAHDSLFDYIKKGKPKEYYENYRVCFDFEYYNGFTSYNIRTIKYPLLYFGELKKLRKFYDINITLWDDGKILPKLLFEELKRDNIILSSYIVLYSYEYKNDKDETIKYYLKSKIGDNNIVLINKKPQKKQIIKNYNDYLWVIKNGLKLNK